MVVSYICCRLFFLFFLEEDDKPFGGRVKSFFQVGWKRRDERRGGKRKDQVEVGGLIINVLQQSALARTRENRLALVTKPPERIMLRPPFWT